MTTDELRAIAESAAGIGYVAGSWWSEDAEFLAPLDKEEAVHIAAWSPDRAIAALAVIAAATQLVHFLDNPENGSPLEYEHSSGLIYLRAYLERFEALP